MINILFVDGWFVEELENEPGVFKKLEHYLPSNIDPKSDKGRAMVASRIEGLQTGRHRRARALSGSGSPNNTKYFVIDGKLVPCRPFGGVKK